MNLLLPEPAAADARFWQETWPAFRARAPLAPFAPLVLEFLDAFSKRVLLDPGLRGAGAFAALAHWARGSHLRDYASRLPAAPGRLRLGRGLVLNLAPANVDTLFAYAWFTSLLCGNLNVVRVSRRSEPAIAPLLGVLRALLTEARFAPIRERTLIVTYEHDDALTTRLSAACQARLVWGGDATVRAIRALPLPATAVEIAFADRFSLAAFAAAPLAALADDALGRLASDFAADALPFAQRACASPRAVVFTGPAAACTRAALRFWPALQAAMNRRDAGLQPADGIARLAAALATAAETPGSRLTHQPAGGTAPLVLEVPGWPASLRDQHDGGGWFAQVNLPDLASLAPHLTLRDQTLVAAGYAPAELQDFAARLPARAVDRIVPPGRALDFEPEAWDGHNLFHLLTREIPFT